MLACGRLAPQDSRGTAGLAAGGYYPRDIGIAEDRAGAIPAGQRTDCTNPTAFWGAEGLESWPGRQICGVDRVGRTRSAANDFPGERVSTTDQPARPYRPLRRTRSGRRFSLRPTVGWMHNGLQIDERKRKTLGNRVSRFAPMEFQPEMRNFMPDMLSGAKLDARCGCE